MQKAYKLAGVYFLPRKISTGFGEVKPERVHRVHCFLHLSCHHDSHHQGPYCVPLRCHSPLRRGPDQVHRDERLRRALHRCPGQEDV